MTEYVKCPKCHGMGTITLENGRKAQCILCHCSGKLDKRELPKLTNFQRITESPEKLAEFISNITCECWGCKRVYTASCPHHKSGLTDFCDRESALEWLKEKSDTE